MRRFRITVVLGLVAGLLSVGTDALAAARTFQVNCSFDPSSPHRALDDPIVNPGGDAAHMHDFFGNVSTNRNSTYADMVAAGTRCELSSDTAAYWVPTLVKPDGTFVAPIRVQVYYRSVNNDTPVTPFPADFRLIAGSSNTANTWWSCTNSTTRTSVPRDCGKANVRATILFPNCGVTDTDGALVRDSLDHRSHAAYHTKGVCPDTHPVLLPKLTVEVRWKLRNGTDHMLSSGDPTSMHADFWNTWQQTAFEGLVESCLNQGIGCGKQVG